MIKEYLELGQIVSTHGIRGELRVNPWCDSPEFAKQFKTVYFDKKGEKSAKVTLCRPHGNIILMKLETVNSVDEAAALRNTVLYIKRADANLPEGTWFIEELIGCEVLDADDSDKKYGILTDVSSTGANDVWYVTDDNKNEYLLPAIKDVVIKVDVADNKAYIRPLKGIFDDAD